MKILKDHLKMKHWKLWLSLVVVVTFMTLANEYPHEKICEIDQAGDKDCATYHGISVVLWHIKKALDSWGGAITALATIAIAGFTAVLWRSTDKLWSTTDGLLEDAQEATGIAKTQREILANLVEMTRLSAEATRATIEAANRPWIEVVAEIGPMVVHENAGMPQYQIQVKVIAKNIGKSPAIKVELAATCGPWVSFDVKEWMKWFSEKAYANRSENGGGGTLFIGDTDELNVGLGMQDFGFPMYHGESEMFIVAVLAYYTSAFSGRVLHTVRSYRVHVEPAEMKTRHTSGALVVGRVWHQVHSPIGSYAE